MLKDEEKWECVIKYIKDVMTTKEEGKIWREREQFI